MGKVNVLVPCLAYQKQLPRIRFLLGMRVVGSPDRGPACVLWMRLGEKLCRGGTRLW